MGEVDNRPIDSRAAASVKMSLAARSWVCFGKLGTGVSIKHGSVVQLDPLQHAQTDCADWLDVESGRLGKLIDPAFELVPRRANRSAESDWSPPVRSGGNGC